ncbi:alpha/beta hydrolase [Lysobacter sp. S4-A87]|uniref:alpha/beta fold hydrolase n=1 Tax=Lysobacter sp. S4-A87 TaxID=2925843 RepID=UPI001F53AF06|nr:alpha/beta hydrolase [Lysobacter sp. S4-A87]UNK47893.1 alpha/beta hydrolase [Lysobacter sp. S4-A87]
MTALVVLPGLDGTATLLSAFADAVRPHFSSVQVVSYPRDQILDYRELEAIARSELPTDAPFVLLGESFSGPIAMSIAANPPEGLVGLVLSTTFSRRPVPSLLPFAPFTSIAPVRRLPESLLSWLLLGDWATPGLRSSLRSALASVSPRVLKTRAAAALRVDCSACLERIKVPVLYLRATGDRLISRTIADSIAATTPQVTVVDIAGPHLLLQAAPGPCAAAVVGFSTQTPAEYLGDHGTSARHSPIPQRPA